MNRINTKIMIAMGLSFYVVFLNYIYIDIIQPLYSYMGYKHFLVSPIFHLLAFLFAVVPAFWLPISLTRPSQVVYWLLYLLVYVPALFLPAYNIEIELYMLFLFNITLFVSFVGLGLFYQLPLLKITYMEIPRPVFWTIFMFLNLLFYGYIIHIFGVKFNLVSLTEVYGVRADYKKVIASHSSILAYAVSWQANVINPFLISQGLINKKYLPLLLFGLGGQFIIYSITGFKTVFFSVGLIIAILIALRGKGTTFGHYLTFGSVSLLIVSTILNNVFHFLMPISLFVRRMILIPGILTGYYFDFFTKHTKLLLSNSVFRSFIQYPYDLDPPHIIGTVYLNDPVTVANANFWADSYANFGFLGVILFSLLLGGFLWLFDSVSKYHDYRIRVLMLGIPAISLSNSALFTTLLTHGLGVVLVLAYFLPKKRILY